MTTGNILLAGLLLGSSITGLGWLAFSPGTRLQRFLSRRPGSRLRRAEPELLDLTGVTITQLRPSGNAFINGKRVAVTSEGALIDQGASIKVVAVRGRRVVVRGF